MSCQLQLLCDYSLSKFMQSSYLNWTLIGLFIRLLIMPFSFHGHDIFYLYYFPYQFLTTGQWNPYLPFSEVHLPQHTSIVYHYPPMMYFIFTSFLFFIKPFLPNLPDLFLTFQTWNFAQQGNTIHFADILMPHQLFRTLFFFKVPYLFFDFISAFFLVRFFKEDKKRLYAYKIWMLNPFTLHSCYALGQSDIIITCLLIVSAYSLSSAMPIKAFLLIPFSSLIKPFSIVILPFAILLQSKKFKDLVILSLPPLILVLTIMLPLYISSGNAMFKGTLSIASSISSYKTLFFVISYSSLLAIFFFFKRNQKDSLDFIIYAFTLPLLCLFTYYVVTLRYFLLITPFLIYLSLSCKRFLLYTTLISLTLFGLKIGGNDLQWGLFAALHPEWMSGLPIFDSFLNLILNVKILHQILYRFFLLVGTIIIIEILYVMKKKYHFSQSLSQPPYA